jgi:hypothetical protein
MAFARAAARPTPAQDLAVPSPTSAGAGRGNSAQSAALGARGAMRQATAGAGGPLPFRAQLEASFGEDFGGVRCFFGQAAALGAIDAGAAAQGEVIAFASARPSKEQVAHELTHVVQRRGGPRAGGAKGGDASGLSAPGGGVEAEARTVAKQAAAGERVDVNGQAGPEVHRDLWGIGNAIGDALDSREDEARLDAEEELAAFRARSFSPLTDHQPSSGIGMFDVSFDAATGAMVVTLKVSYNFVNGAPAKVAPGFRPEEFQWTPEEQALWKTRYQSEVSAQWSNQYVFACTKPFWSALRVSCTVQVVEDAADPHYVLTVGKYPPDAGMAQSSVCPPGTSHDPAGGNTCPANPADGAGHTPNNGSGKFDNNDLRPEQKLDWGNPVVAIPFRRGSSALGGPGRAAATGVVNTLKADATARVQLTGRASATHKAGSDATQGAVENMDVARARAAAVRAVVTSGGVSGARITERNAGEQGAGAGDEWCRVDAQVGNHQQQSPALHETGHMLGLGDEYPETGSPAGTGVDPAYQAMITATTGETLARGRDEGAMSVGSTVRRWNYSSFMEALRTISGVQEWTI